MKKLMLGVLSVGVMGAFAGPNLLQNGDFAVGGIAWKDRTNPKQTVSFDKGVLSATISDGSSKNEGQVVQFRNVRPNAVYRVSAKVRGDLAGFGYVQVKEMNGKKEGARHMTEANGKAGDWVTVSKDITTGPDTTALQVLLRFRMKGNYVGKTVAFDDVKLEGISGGAEKDEAAAPVKAPEAVKDVVAGKGSDATIHPGDSKEAVAAAFAKLGPGNILTIAAGEYTNLSGIELKAGGTKDKPIVIRGEVKGGKRPVITGTWKREAPAKGPHFLSLKPGVSYVTIENLDLNHFRSAIIANGPNHGVKVSKVDLAYTRDGYVLDGGMVGGLPESGSSGWEFTDCNVTFHSKKGFRTANGVHHCKFIRCKTDGGGKDYANIEPRDIFSVGFQINGSYRAKGGAKPDHHLEFIECEANNNYYDPTPKRYWNADGFCSEAATHDLTFIRCKASGNTDGGWDLKTTRPKLIECVSSGNKRNYRVWSKSGEVALFEKCVSENCWNVGNSGHDTGFWCLGGGEVDYIGCVSKNDRYPFSVEAHNKPDGSPADTVIKIRNCKIEPANEKVFFRREGNVKVDTDGSVKVD